MVDINMNELLNVMFRAFVSLITLFLITKMIGKKQVSQLSLFDYVIGISIGNFAAEMTINLDSSEVYGVIAVIIFGLVAYLVSYLTMKSIKLRRYFIGMPTIIIDKGNIIEKNLVKCKLDINDLLEVCRVNGYFDISDIEYAIFEANGEMSILPTSDATPTTNKTMSVKKEKIGLCSNVIIDGKIMHNNISAINKNHEWLIHELKVKGYNNEEDILLATVDINQKLTIYDKNVDKQTNNMLE